MAPTIYARVTEQLKAATEDFAEQSGMTLANAVSHLLELGLQAAGNEKSVSALESTVAEQARELGSLRKQETQMQVMARRLNKPVGKCPKCAHEIKGTDLLTEGECPECHQSLTNLLAATTAPTGSEPGLNETDVKVLLTALGVFLGLALLTRE